ncbi:MAG: hypothetical protein IJ282_10325 [Lachnospiraceae bacterium]|nr:hypothetical protein [Lachnospiraceae bacterium]
MQTAYMKQKINNEMEICEITDLEAKQLIEKTLLKNRISYYLKWPKAKFWSRRRVICILCVNDNSRDEAEEAIRSLGEDVTDYVRFVARKSDNVFL